MNNDIIEDALLDAAEFISRVLKYFGSMENDGNRVLERIDEALKLRAEERP